VSSSERSNVVRRFAQGGLVKICGLREPEHAAAAAAAGADLIGFVFAPARRRVTPEQARRCIAAAREAGGASTPPLAVGVFVDASAEEIADTALRAGLDLVQLHGDEPPGFAATLPLPAVKALKPPPAAETDETTATASACLIGDPAPVALLIDGFHPSSAGGAGVQANWTLAAAVAKRSPMLLAGGLTPGNVGAAIQMVKPLGVDVSSGVEIDGAKDSRLIAAFVGEARAAFAASAQPARIPVRVG